MWFEPSGLLKTKTEPLATPATLEMKNSKKVSESRKVAKVAEHREHKPIIVICYSPSGLVYEIETTSPEHAAWLVKMNLKSKRDHLI